jgi:hypothetical protein
MEFQEPLTDDEGKELLSEEADGSKDVAVAVFEALSDADEESDENPDWDEESLELELSPVIPPWAPVAAILAKASLGSSQAIV